MRSSSVRAVYLTLCAVVFASCSRATAYVPQFQGLRSGAVDRFTGGGYQTLYNFPGAPDGADPVSGLVALNGKLYGTTASGGTGACTSGGCGTVFEMGADGAEKVIYSFKGEPDGATPQAGLTAVDGTLYGTTQTGGSGPGEGNGTVFALTTSGKERVLHRFVSGSDGASPYGVLFASSGALYGTTYTGGRDDGGTVFSVSRSGRERVIYRFRNEPDGRNPLAGVIDVDGTLYGTTAGGGRQVSGTVFRVSTSGKERVLYSFEGRSDGEVPAAALTVVGGALYGTTVYGGMPSSSNGTVFTVSLSGKERVVYRFRGGKDGASPFGTLIAANGSLYGTTYFGGNGRASGPGDGTIFEVSTSGSESVLHRFDGGADGANPAAGLLARNATLYGTTSQAGLSGPSGYGTIFKL